MLEASYVLSPIKAMENNATGAFNVPESYKGILLTWAPPSKCSAGRLFLENFSYLLFGGVTN